MVADSGQRVFLLASKLRSRSVLFALVFSVPAALAALEFRGIPGYAPFLAAATVLLWACLFRLNRIKTFITPDELVMTDILSRKIRRRIDSISRIEEIAGFWSRVFGGRLVRATFKNGERLILGPFEDTDGFLRCLSGTPEMRTLEPGSPASGECNES